MGEGVNLAVIAALAAGAVGLGHRGAREIYASRLVAAVGGVGVGGSEERPTGRAPAWLGRLHWVGIAAILGGVGAVGGWLAAGPMGVVMGVVAGAGGPVARRRRRDRNREEMLEQQLAEVAASTSLALRSGLAVAQALEFSRAEAPAPIRQHLDRFIEEQRLGAPFELALERLGEALGTDDARFFVLVTSIHAKSGGDLAGALDEVGRTIHHRVDVRRELRAASAQGRISGAIMGVLPFAFFLFLSLTAHDRLAPILRSGTGMAMVGTGLTLEALAYLWIRRILRVEV